VDLLVSDRDEQVGRLSGHEVGVFSALLLAWLGFRSINEKNRLALAVHVALLAAPIVIFVAVIALGGSKGSTR
jgi:hypothetical protein